MNVSRKGSLTDFHPALLDQGEVREYINLVRGGTARSKAARAVADCTARTIENRIEALGLTDTFLDALEDGRRERADLVDDRMDTWVDQEECSPTLRIAWAKRWNPAYRDKVEHTGDGGGPIRVDQRTMVVDMVEVLGILREAGVTSGDPGLAESVAGPPVLPPPPDA